MNYGKKKKMAVGGTTGKFVKDRSRKSGKRFVSNRSAMLKEIDELKDSMKGASKNEKAEMQKLIDAKKAGIKSTSLTFMDQIGFPGKHITNRNYRSPIPTRTGTKMDEDSIEALKRRNVLKKESKREKKAGGSVKKMAMGGKAMKDVPMDKKKSLGALPEEVRNKMGFKKAGGKVKMMKKGGSTGKRKADPMPPLGVPKFEEPRATAKGQRKAGGMINKKKMKAGGTPGGTLRDRLEGPKPRRPKMGDKPKYKPAGDKPKGKKMMGGGMAMKYKKGGMTKKCPRDGIAKRGKTRA
jgi:hypothetical protein